MDNFIPGSSPARSDDAADISALLFTVFVVAVIGWVLTFGVTLAIAWVLRDSLAPILGVL